MRTRHPIRLLRILLTGMVALGVLSACRREPFASTYTRKEPAVQDLAGSYFPSKETAAFVRGKMGDRQLTSRIILRDDHTFHIENVPDWMKASKPSETGDLATRKGTWKIEEKDRRWLLAITYQDGARAILRLHRDQPPYRIHLTLGDPMAGQVLEFVKRF